MTIKKILAVIALITCTSYSNAELIKLGNTEIDSESFLILKNPNRVTFTLYQKPDVSALKTLSKSNDASALKTLGVVNCQNQTFYVLQMTVVDKNHKFVAPLPESLSGDVPTKDHPVDLIKDSVPHIIYQNFCRE